LLAEHRISIAPLQITTQSQNVELEDESGHFHRRKELTETFNKPKTGNINYAELFQAAKAEAIAKSQSYSYNE